MDDANSIDCHVCKTLASLTEEQVVLREGAWTVTTVAGAPGLLMVCTNAHDAGLASLPAPAAAAFGTIVARVSAQLQDVAGADRVAMILLADRSRHTHFVLVARQGADEPVADLTALEKRVAATRDPAVAARMAATMRAALKA